MSDVPLRRKLHIAEGKGDSDLPHCLALVVDPRALVRTDLPSAPLRKLALDDQVQRDSRGGTIVAAVLGVIVLICVVVFLSSGGPQLVSASKEVRSCSASAFLSSVRSPPVRSPWSPPARTRSSPADRRLRRVVHRRRIVVLAIVLTCMGILRTLRHALRKVTTIRPYRLAAARRAALGSAALRAAAKQGQVLTSPRTCKSSSAGTSCPA